MAPFNWLTRLCLVASLLLYSLVDSFVAKSFHPSLAHRHDGAATTRAPTELHVKRFLSKVMGRQKSTPDIVKETLTSRRTVNNFETTKVPDNVVESAINAAIYAPCHKMTEPWRFIILGNETISKISSLNAAEIAKKDPAKGEKKKKRWEAIPGWCVVTSAKSDGGLQEREDYAATCCAIQNFMLSLWSQGVGTKWTTGPITRTPEFAELCAIDLNKEEVAGCIWYGYAANEDSIPVPKRKKSVEDVTSRRP